MFLNKTYIESWIESATLKLSVGESEESIFWGLELFYPKNTYNM